MKILLITFEFPPQKGGMENYYFNLIKNINGLEFTVLTCPFKDSQDFDKQQSFKIIRKKLLWNFIWPRWLKLYFLVKKAVKKEKIDLLWVGDVLPIGSAALLLRYFYKIKYFVSTHGLDIMLPQRSLKKEKLMKKILQNSEFITANSLFTKKELANLGLIEEKIELVYPCPNISAYLHNLSIEKIDRVKSDLNLSNKNILLTVGRLVARKGQDMVIKALPRLLERIPNLV